MDRAFSIPKSLLLSNVSISLSDGELSFFEMKRSGGKISPKAWGTLPFPKIRLSTCTEKQKADAISALTSFSKSRGCREVHALVHEGEAYVFRATLPTIEKEEIRPAIESLLEENVPMPPAEAVFEYSIVSRDTMRGETTVAVSVISKRVVSGYTDLLLAADLVPISLETEARALSRALFAPHSDDVALVLSIHASHSLIFIVERGAVVFSSSIDTGSNDINQIVSKTLNVSKEAARDMKREVFEAALPVFSSLHDEIGKVLVFWKAQEKKLKGFRDISRIVLSGGDALTWSFARYVSITFKLPTEVGSVWTNIAQPEVSLPSITRRDSLDYGTVIGTLIQ